jgi:2-oxoglutarate dehydrogenase E1 component
MDRSGRNRESRVARYGVNAALVEEMRERHRIAPSSVDPGWAELFADDADCAPCESARPEHERLEPAVGPTAQRTAASGTTTTRATGGAIPDDGFLHARVERLIHAYRARGHRVAQSDPLGGNAAYFSELEVAHHGLTDADLDQQFASGDLPGGPTQTLREIETHLRETYCGPIGVEFMHIQDPGRKAWLQQRMESCRNQPDLSDDARLRILEKLSQSELFERFLHTKFVGQKRFSLEGAESLIPLLDTLVEHAPQFGIREFVFGTTHRGRLNILANVLGKSYETIFGEFEDTPVLDAAFGSGDVKYHKGFSSDRRVHTGDLVHLTLTSNPSHLEAVDPVVEGRTKAKQVRSGDVDGTTIVPVIVHGDAAFAGQGIVAETLNLSQLSGYSTGGTFHVIVNNQIGFTTGPADARSTLYCTDVAKMIQVPIFHVNGDDPEAVIYCALLAMAYREHFGDDVVIDMVCYRRHGHNEADEPSFTQPRLYSKIKKRPSVRKLCVDRLVSGGVISEVDAEQIEQRLSEELAQALEVVHVRAPEPDEPYEPHGPWKGFSRLRPEDEVKTAVDVERLAQIAEGLGRAPSHFEVHRKLVPFLEKRAKTVAEDMPIDWSMGEALAFGSLLVEGTPVRLSGQDSSRATFSQRHAVIVDQQSGEAYAPLDNLTETQASFEVYDSLLSEAAVLGFEYGYSLSDPTTLTLWEAQFGDFANGAQVIIDQFITSAHVKWGRMSGLVMLLPHGFEGQGPEHSSARVERFLQTCAEDNVQVVNCTTPAQYFHLLRRQMRRVYRAPLVLLTPKSLLRLPVARSRVGDLTHGRFEPVLDDERACEAPEAIQRVIFCSGKVYYDLLAGRPADVAERTAIVRVEQLYPWSAERVGQILAAYSAAESVLWVQEEPQNMGPWTFVRDRLSSLLLPRQQFGYAGRRPAASPAAGSRRVHLEEQAALVAQAFEGLERRVSRRDHR